MESYQRRMSALRSGEFVPPPEDSYDPAADILAHQSKHKKQAVETESYLNKEQLLELRRVQHERIEVCFNPSLVCVHPPDLLFSSGGQNETPGNGR
jgi:hypothetical protein